MRCRAPIARGINRIDNVHEAENLRLNASLFFEFAKGASPHRLAELKPPARQTPLALKGRLETANQENLVTAPYDGGATDYRTWLRHYLSSRAANGRIVVPFL